MIGIICICKHFAAYTFHARSFFPNNYTTSGHITAMQRMHVHIVRSNQKIQKIFLTWYHSFTERKSCTRWISCIILNVNANFEIKKSILGRFGSSLSQTSVYWRHSVFKLIASRLVERINVTGTVSGRLRSIVPRMRSLHKDDMTSTSPTWPIIDGARYLNFCHC